MWYRNGGDVTVARNWIGYIYTESGKEKYRLYAEREQDQQGGFGKELELVGAALSVTHLEDMFRLSDDSLQGFLC